MKTRGRPKSSNIDDRRAYFGTNSLSKANTNKRGAIAAFRMESFKSAREFKGSQPWNKFTK